MLIIIKGALNIVIAGIIIYAGLAADDVLDDRGMPVWVELVVRIASLLIALAVTWLMWR